MAPRSFCSSMQSRRTARACIARNIDIRQKQNRWMDGSLGALSWLQIDDAIEYQVAPPFSAARNFLPAHPDKRAPAQPASTLPRALHINASTWHLFFFDEI